MRIATNFLLCTSVESNSLQTIYLFFINFTDCIYSLLLHLLLKAGVCPAIIEVCSIENFCLEVVAHLIIVIDKFFVD